MKTSELEVATAALLVHGALVDGRADRAERETLKSLLIKRFGLSGSEADALITAAAERERDAVDLYGFTKILAHHLGQEGRLEVVEMLWEMAHADGEVDEFESNLVWRVAELLGVSTRDRVRLRQKVARRRAHD